MATINDSFPLVKEFGPGATSCAGQMTGCAVCSTAEILLRFGKPIPRTASGYPDMQALGRSMGRRHRNVQNGNRHGLSGSGSCSPPNNGTNWCGFCGYLELKARGVPMAYGQLTRAQVHTHLERNHPMLVPGLYSRVPLIGTGSYTPTTAARGRSDSGFGGAHMVTAYLLVNDRVFIGDPDFGSPGRPVVPIHSVWTTAVFDRYRESYNWPVAYAIIAPPPVGQPAAPSTPGVTYRYGGMATKRGSYVVRDGVNVRTSPYIRGDNVAQVTSGPTTFACAQTTYSGTNVGGSTTWYGTRAGNRWVHESLAKLKGHTTGKEEIK
jgi:hypothetical protein